MRSLFEMPTLRHARLALGLLCSPLGLPQRKPDGPATSRISPAEALRRACPGGSGDCEAGVIQPFAL